MNDPLENVLGDSDTLRLLKFDPGVEAFIFARKGNIRYQVSNARKTPDGDLWAHVALLNGDGNAVAKSKVNLSIDRSRNSFAKSAGHRNRYFANLV